MLVRYDKIKHKLDIIESTRIEYNQVKLHLIRKARNYKYAPSFKRGVWDGNVDNFKSGNIDYGLWKEIAICLQEIGCVLKVQNKEELPSDRNITLESVTKFCVEFFKDHYRIDKETDERVPFMPYDHQIEAVYRVLKNRFCTVEVATSGGKSLIISIVYFYILSNLNSSAKFLLVVPSITLVTQFFDDMMEYNIGKFKENKNPVDLRVMEIMSDKPRKWHGDGEPNVTISTYQSLANVNNFGEKFYQQFQGVCCDEAHLAKSASFKKILRRTIKKTNYQFGVSGTFQDDTFAEFLTIQSLTGPKVIKVRAKELQDKGIISYVNITQFHLNHNDPEFLDKLTQIRNGKNGGVEAYRLEGDYIRCSKDRMRFLVKIVSMMKRNTLVMFYIIEYGIRIVEELELFLKERIDNGEVEIHTIHGTVKKDKREEIKAKLELDDGVIRILVATYGTLSTGVSINNLHNAIFAEGFKAEGRMIQSIGRVLRLHEEKDMAQIYDLVDRYTEEKSRTALLRHGFDRLDMYKKHEYPYKIKKIIF